MDPEKGGWYLAEAYPWNAMLTETALWLQKQTPRSKDAKDDTLRSKRLYAFASSEQCSLCSP